MHLLEREVPIKTKNYRREKPSSVPLHARGTCTGPVSQVYGVEALKEFKGRIDLSSRSSEETKTHETAIQK